MPLRDLQREFQRELLSRDSSIALQIVDAPPISVDERLEIYRNAYHARLIDALQETYPVVHALLGDEDFALLGESFVAAHPSVYRSIRWYGSELCTFLAETQPFAEQPIFSEIAKLEWTLSEVFDAADAAPLTREHFKRLEPGAWGELTFRFHPSLRQLLLEWNTVAVWQAINEEREPPAPECAAPPLRWLLWRRDLTNYFRSMDAIESAALEAALEGASFARLCECLASFLTEDEIPPRAAALIAQWADGGILIEAS